MDVVYDYFIANDAELFSEVSLFDFTQVTYRQLCEHQNWFPEKFARMFPYMKEQNWLYNYRYIWGIEKSFGGLVKRAAYLDESEKAFRLFEENIMLLQECYNRFSSDIKAFAKKRFDEITNP